MFSIDYPADAVMYHYSNVEPYITAQLTKQQKKQTDAHSSALLSYVKDHLLDIITGKPDELMRIYKEDFTDTLKFDIKTDKELFESLFNYDTFVKREKGGAYALTRKLGIRVCPYCNQQYTLTVFDEDNRIIRPELDHYFPKSKFPMFALSFFNLIPSCHICNSNIKHDKDLDIEQHYHPYIPHSDGFRFRMGMASLGETSIRLDYSKIPNSAEQEMAKKTAEFFKLDKIYAYHSGESDQIYELYQEFDRQLLQDTYDALNQNGIIISKSQLLDKVYSRYQSAALKGEPLGKLKADLYRQIKKHYLPEK